MTEFLELVYGVPIGELRDFAILFVRIWVYAWTVILAFFVLVYTPLRVLGWLIGGSQDY